MLKVYAYHFFLQVQLVLVGDIKSCVDSLCNVQYMSTCKILSDNLYNSNVRLKIRGVRIIFKHLAS